MAVVTRKSTFIGNRDATPTVPTGASIAGGNVREASGYVTTVTGDSALSVYPMVSIPSNSRVAKVSIACAAQSTSAAVNVGVYAPTQSPPSLVALGYANSVAISAAFFASALAVSSALGPTDITNQSGSNTLDKQEMEIWQALGLASDPGCNLDISIAVSVAIAAGGLMGIRVAYVQ